MPLIPFSLILCCSILAFAAWYYRQSRRGTRPSVFLWTVRLLLLAGILCAFFQPVLTLHTLAPQQSGAVALIDASRSMRLFNADSSISRLIAALENPPRNATGPLPKIGLLCFGDSLRQASGAAAVSFSDRQSFFPDGADNPALEQARIVLIISDGNWSNASLPRAIAEDKTCYFLTLPHFDRRPSLDAECVSFARETPQDSSSPALLRVEGYKKTARPLDVAVKEGASAVLTAKCAADTGYFSDTLSVALPPAKPGRHLYNVAISDAPDSLGAHLYLVRQVVPGVFKAAVYGPASSLDKRFLGIALSNNGWRLSESDPDALFLLGWDNHAQEALAGLKPSATAVFIGCAPASSPQSIVPDSFSMLAAQQDDTLSRRIESSQLPPPSAILRIGQSPADIALPILNCIVHKTGSPPALRDTMPFFAAGKYKGRTVLLLAAPDVWKMQFLPLGVGRESEGFSFLQYLSLNVKNVLYGNLGRAFFAYPASSGPTDHDSCDFSFVIPSEPVLSSSQSAKPPAIRFALRRNGRPALDTSFSALPAEISGIQALRLPPLPAGAYYFTAAYSSQNVHASCADSLFVQSEDLEFSVQGQNTALLKQLALPLEMNDTKGIRAALAGDAGRGKTTTTVAKTFQIRQSWWLLIVLIGLCTVEWAVRRRIGLDS